MNIYDLCVDLTYIYKIYIFLTTIKKKKLLGKFL